MSIVYLNDFEADTLGSISPNWVNGADAGSDAKVNASSVISGTRSFGIANPPEGATAVFGGQSTLGNQSVRFLTRYRRSITSVVSSCSFGAPMCCLSANAQNGYVALIGQPAGDVTATSVASGNATLYRRDSGNFTPLQTVVVPLPNDGTVMYSRIERSGNVVRARFWAQGESEPSTWTLSTTDTTYMTGRQGVRFSNTDQSAAFQTNIDDFSVDDLVPVVTIVPGDANLFASPYNWRRSGTAYLEANSKGAYHRITPSGDVVMIGLDPSLYAAYPANQCPMLKVYVDGVPRTPVQLGPSQTSLMVSGMGAGTHQVQVFLASVYVFGNSWTGNAVRITGYSVPSGQTFSAPTLRPKRFLAFGDSITGGESDLAVGSITNAVAETDASLSYAILLGTMLNAEVGIVAYGGWGWETASAGSVPRFDEAWSSYSSGQSRLTSGKLTPIPDYVTNNLGANGAVSASTVTAWLLALRAAVNTTTPIVEVLPFNTGRSNNSAIGTGVSTANDLYAKTIDLGTEGQSAVTTGGADGTHPPVAGHAILPSIFTGSLVKAPGIARMAYPQIVLI